jgi:hypothetical protein
MEEDWLKKMEEGFGEMEEGLTSWSGGREWVNAMGALLDFSSQKSEEQDSSEFRTKGNCGKLQY